jgi:cell division protein FtsW
VGRQKVKIRGGSAGIADNFADVLRASHILMLCAMALLGIGVVMVQSAGMNVGPDVSEASRGGVWAILLGRPTYYALIAVVAMLFASRVNVRQLFRTRAWYNPLILIVLLSLVAVGLTFVPGLGRNVNGASRWLYLGPRSWGLSFQPSELVKWVMVLAIAWWCARRRYVMHRFFIGLLPPLLLIAVSCGLILVEDLGTGALIAGVAGCMLVAGGARLWQFGLMIPPAAAAIVAAILHAPYRVKRLTAFLNPWEDPAGGGYHLIQSMLAIAQGNLTGRGLGNGVQKFGYLPEDTTDFIFAIICEELGVAGAGLVIALYLVILWVGLGIVKECRDTFGRLVGLGVLLTVGLQATMNIAVVTVVVPPKGIALPLVSAGGTGWIMTAFAIGLIASLDNANQIAAENRPDAAEPEYEGILLEPA